MTLFSRFEECRKHLVAIAMHLSGLGTALLTLGISAFMGRAAASNFINFETAPVHPIALGPDNRTLAVCNLPDNRVEFFDVSTGVPQPTGSVPVGLDPVTARFATSNQVWVVNYISSTISVIDVGRRTVVATIETPAGPRDVVFAGSPRRAWISCSRTNSVLVVDVTSFSAVTNVLIDAERPRAMATSPDGSRVYAAIFESGNGTTVIGRRISQLFSIPFQNGPLDDTNGPYGGMIPPPNAGTNFVPAIRSPTNSVLPQVSHIVRKNNAGRWMDDNSADWTEWVSGTNSAISGRIRDWDLPDRDLAIIDTANLEVSYSHRLMNICMAVGVNPVSGQIAVVGTDATNERRFEPLLNGVFLRVNLALVDPVTRTNRLRDLNPHLDYVTRTLPEAGRALSLGDPRAIEWNAAGTRAYITGMGSRNMITIDPNGNRIGARPIELPDGPTGIALDESRGRAYIWNRFASSISVVDTTANLLLTNVGVFDATPAIIRKGRSHLYDTRKTSGLGMVACGSCHVDARFDRLAWDLGNSTNAAALSSSFHPMKGPMLTQTFQDIITPSVEGGSGLQEQVLHWRGDRNNLEEFNPTFTDLQANDRELTTNEMAEFKAMLSTIFFPPNPLRTFSNSLPVSVPLPGHYTSTFGGTRGIALPPGNPQAARQRYDDQCVFCHSLNTGGRSPTTNLQVFPLPRSALENTPTKISHLRTLADRVGMDRNTTNSRAGFGYMHDGGVDTLSRFLVEGDFVLNADPQVLADMTALLLCFTGSDLTNAPLRSQDVPAATGRQITFASPTAPSFLNAMVNLARDTNSRVDLVIRGKQENRTRGWLLRRDSGQFESDRNGEMPQPLAEVISLAAAGNEYTATMVPEGSGRRVALDRDSDGYFDASESDWGTDPADPSSHPARVASINKSDRGVVLSWESISGARYVVEWRSTLPLSGSDPWEVVEELVGTASDIISYTNAVPATVRHRFYRVRRTR